MTLTDAERQRIAERYPQRRRPWLIPAVSLPLVGLVVLWLIISTTLSNPPLTGQVTTFEVTSPTSITIEVMVDRARPEVSGHCLVYATAKGGEKVGEVQMPVASDAQEVTRQRVVVRTFRPPESAHVERCVAS